MEFATISNRDVKPDAPAGSGGSSAFDRVNGILGYDVRETLIIEKDPDLRTRVAHRMSTNGPTLPAEDVLGPLDDKG